VIQQLSDFFNLRLLSLQALFNQRCLDYIGRTAAQVVTERCDQTSSVWEEYLPFEPVETALYNKAKRETPEIFSVTYSK
jgi:hypothetical protein